MPPPKQREMPSQFEVLRPMSLAESTMNYKLQTLKLKASRMHHYDSTRDERNGESNGFEIPCERTRSLEAAESMFAEPPNSSSFQSGIVVVEEQDTSKHGDHRSEVRNTSSISAKLHKEAINIGERQSEPGAVSVRTGMWGRTPAA